MNFDQQMAMMISSKKQTEEIAGMYLITSELQETVKKLIESNKQTNENLVAAFTQFHSIAPSKIENSIRNELKSVGKLVTESTLEACSKSVLSSVNRINQETKLLASSSEIFKEASKRLSLKVWFATCTALILTILLLGILGKIWLSDMVKEIKINQQELYQQKKSLSILGEHGVKVISTTEGVFIITPKGLGAAKCDGNPCYYLK